MRPSATVDRLGRSGVGRRPWVWPTCPRRRRSDAVRSTRSAPMHLGRDMDGHRFDKFAKTFAMTGASRRQALKLLAGGAVSAGLLAVRHPHREVGAAPKIKLRCSLPWI